MVTLLSKNCFEFFRPRSTVRQENSFDVHKKRALILSFLKIYSQVVITIFIVNFIRASTARLRQTIYLLH